MSSSYESSQRSKSIFNTGNIVLASIGWAVLALLYFLLFSAKVPGADGVESRAEWYVIGTNIFEALAYLGAGILCLRNWRSQKIVSGRNVWLAIGIGMLSYFLGGIFFGYTEIILKEEPDVSIGDVFFVVTYLCLGTGMILAAAHRRINLEKWQWLVVLAIGVFGSLLAWWISLQQPKPLDLLGTVLNWFYIVSDVAILIIATTLLLAFWGGKVAQSWRMIAAAAFSLYIADMWFKYAQGPNYQSGEILEVFWVFSGVLFGMGAALEYEASLSRSRRERGRKRA
ncbi:hypothetical protein NIES37_00600 [Tolypothrix tenuis PCC 7101]|uniref:Uncharacterized protein n=1 Tax=Tolypothrix tenuis PCC 7101 TaxID=231146 RepID=A0A1Z4MRL6_9CYAN|nr:MULTISPECIES: hypothetical protein [unclassified Tolypothrix]MBD2240629.1 hypothetical protein [Aulosira sp. FACHB-113]BAY93233.1 hypothetical protein NIES3275_52710 [Microchaete diplosiphon NIES-3275]BAY96133.1 hypothetical protein NIES37_00600 [Tolypothrix tenuis PCC 7101]BAZ73360.1 hypothetical protein NIES50_19240 [Aulosira laxa NIES-50]EKF00210.1 hypothetical protein FDUTEX481_09183 [Tolypothrix sp. PCC 7601]